MADELPPETSKRHRPEDEEIEEEEEESEGLVELKQMAQVINKYRSTLPVQIKNNFSSLIAAQRPLLLTPSDQTPVSADDGYNAKSSEERQLADEDPEIADKAELLKHKISSLTSALPSLLKRLNNSSSVIDKLDTYNVTIHPAFKKRRT